MNERLTLEGIEKTAEELKNIKPLTKEQEKARDELAEKLANAPPMGNILPEAGMGEWKPAFEPAKEGEEPPKNIWIPNRRERRLMKKRGNKVEKAMSKFYQEAITDAKEYVNTSNYKNEIYKALYEKVKARNEEMEREIATNGTTVVEGN